MSYGFTYTTRLDGQVVFAAHINALGAATDVAFTAVESAVNGVAASIASKGAITGQAWSGSHSFTGPLSTATPASSVSSTEVVTAAWVLAKLTGTPAENFGGQLYASSQINGGM